jgi:hypothetical protein
LHAVLEAFFPNRYFPPSFSAAAPKPCEILEKDGKSWQTHDFVGLTLSPYAVTIYNTSNHAVRGLVQEWAF